MSKKYLSDILGKDFAEDFDFLKKVNSKMPCVIQAPTGYGKSTFFKQEFCDYCRKNGYTAIMLLPRTAPIEEFAEEIKATNNANVLKLATYQHIASTGDTLDYDFIICDECHFFVTDSIFNNDTDISYELVRQSRGIKIFISATPEPFMPILSDYFGFQQRTISENENDNIKAVNLLPLNNKKQVHETVCNIMPTLQHKAIVFCRSAEDAHNIWARFSADALFVCSKDNQYYADVNQEAYKKMLHEHRFECKYLVCTSAVDVGISINDPELTDIICTFEPDNWTSIVQCIGRKRNQNENDKITLHLRDCNENRINDLISATQHKLEHYDYYKSHDLKAYFKQYRKRHDPSGILYPDFEADQVKLKIDRFKLAFYHYRLDVLEQVQQCGSYRKYLRQNLKLVDDTPVKHRKKSSYNRDVLAQFAKTDRIFTTADRDEFIKAINYRKANGDLYKDIDILNEYMRQMGAELPFEIVRLGKNKERREEYKIIFRLII